MLLKRPMLAAGATVLLSLLLLPVKALWLGAAVACFAALLFCGKRFRRLLLALLCVFAASGAWGLMREVVADSRAERFDGKTAYVEAYVCELPPEGEFGGTCTLRLRSVTVDGETYDCSEKAQVWLDPELEVEFYDVLKFSASVEAIPAADVTNGVHYKLTASETPHVAGRAAKTPYYYCLKLKEYMLGRLNADGETRNGATLSALLLGDRSGVPYETSLAFRKCGVSHLLVVSGLHVVTVTMFCFEILRRLTKRPPVIPALILVWILAALTAFSASAVRAAIMLSIVLCAGLFSREGDGLNSLGVAVFAMCAFSPSIVRDVGFLLSVSATAGLLAIAPRIRGWLAVKMKTGERTRPVRGLLYGVSEVIAQSVAAWLATLPVTVFCFGSVSLIAPLANLLTLTPAAITLTLGFPAATLPWIGVGFLRVAGVGVSWLVWITEKLAALPFSYAYVAYPYMLAFAAAAVAAYFAVKRRYIRRLFASALALSVFLAGAVCSALTAADVRVDSVFAGTARADFVTVENTRVLFVANLSESACGAVLSRAGGVGITAADEVVCGDIYSVAAAERLAAALGAEEPLVPALGAESGGRPAGGARVSCGVAELTISARRDSLDLYVACGGTLLAFTSKNRLPYAADAVFAGNGYAGAARLLVTGSQSGYGVPAAEKTLFTREEGVLTFCCDGSGLRLI